MIDAKLKGNFTRFINHSDMQDNVAFFEKRIGKNNVVDVIATRNIQAGEQLLIDYNTHDDRFISEFFFLNPNDSWLSVREVYDAYVKEYQLVKMNIDLPLFKFKKGDLFYVTQLGVEILKNYGGETINNDEDDDVIVQGSNLIIIEDEEDDMDEDDELNYHESLSSVFCLQGSQTAGTDHNKKAVTQKVIDLPFIKLHEDGKTILDFNQTDSFTALMYACYWGQIENVKWLINAGANVNQQQNHSGMNALFFALQGYCEGLVATDRYLKIIRLLVASGVNTASYDRTEQSFLHKAIELLGKDSFQTLINHLKEKTDFDKILDFLDANNMDPILSCFQQKNFEKAEILLNCYPGYFEETFMQENEDTEVENEDIVVFSKIIKTYTLEDKKRLLQLLKQFEADTSTNIIDILGLQEDSSSNLVLK
ncbi:ankyrin repeat domain-containing protein [Legionella drancourtii]|uniref:ankyrin repeat domain-containing protein n=1 Tax=Legionella drancourtii TaxID=168933 RepID=UPI002D21BF98|nr:ankyrin repeat domain-containing protein [Legionella drancourtii]